MRNEKISLRHFTKAKMHFARWKRVPSPSSFMARETTE